MTVEEIKAQQLMRQHLTHSAELHTVARDLCGVQAQFMSNAMHALRIRSTDFSETAAREKLVKSWTVRGTVHVFAPDDLPLFLHEGRKHVLRPCDTLESDNCLSRERKQFFADLILEAAADGPVERDSLREMCTAAGMTQEEGESLFNAWGGLLRALCEAGKLCHCVQERKAFQLCPPFVPMDRCAAELEMARRYFTHFAPATIRDAAYFSASRRRRSGDGWNSFRLHRLNVRAAHGTPWKKHRMCRTFRRACFWRALIC